MDTKQAAATLRANYKAAGWNARMVSVRTDYFSMGSSIRVTVRSAAVDFGKAKAMAEDVEHIDRCQITGEILSGGNRYVEVELSESAKAELASRHLEALRAAVAELDTLSENTHADVAGTDATVSKGRWGFELWLGDRHYAAYQREDYGLVAAAVAIATVEGPEEPAEPERKPAGDQVLADIIKPDLAAMEAQLEVDSELAGNGIDPGPEAAELAKRYNELRAEGPKAAADGPAWFDQGNGTTYCSDCGGESLNDCPEPGRFVEVDRPEDGKCVSCQLSFGF